MSKVIYDITLALTPRMTVYPGDPQFTIEQLLNLDQGDPVNLSKIEMCLHTGTHIDAPRHFYNKGLSVEQLPWRHFIGTAKVIEIKGKKSIAAMDLKCHAIAKDDIVLLKTDNSTLLQTPEFNPDYVYLTADAAEYLAKVGIVTLGFDYLSVDRYGSSDFSVHQILLGNNIIIIESLNLSGIEPGEYQMIAMPLKIKDCDGSPTRVILHRESC